jgi:hypothetical protein
VGLVARYLEEHGFSTVVLTMTPEFTRQIGIPRVAALEYPYGRPVGQVYDVQGQRDVLLQTLSALEQIKKPGEVLHLPFTWPESPKETNWHPPVRSPIIQMFIGEIKEMKNGSTSI